MTVTILGNNSALPAFGRHPSAQVVEVNGEMLLLDCGEGTQIQFQRYGLKWKKLKHIYISHLHGDHYFGMPGFLNSMNLLGRTAELHLYAPAALEEIINLILSVADTTLSFPYFFHPLQEGASQLTDNELFTVTAFPVEHRIACHGFLIESKTRGRRILPERCEKYGVPLSFYEALKHGTDYTNSEGIIIKNDLLTEEGPHASRYAYCADTIFTESFLPFIRSVDTLYHECTYLEADAEKAKMRFHSTAKQAASLAKHANAGKLLLGHFSSKYRELDAFKTEAESVFPNVVITEEGITYDV